MDTGFIKELETVKKPLTEFDLKEICTFFYQYSPEITVTPVVDAVASRSQGNSLILHSIRELFYAHK